MGEFLYFCIYVVQQLGIMFGVGAQTVLLCMHLFAVHHGEKENPHASYARAAHFALGLGLLFIFVSGVVAVTVHTLNGELSIVLTPAFLFKWLLILLLLPAYFLHERLTLTSNVYYAFTGATWYALFLVHSLGPVTTWPTLFVLYALWLVFFSSVWAAFVGVMRWSMRPVALPAPVVRKQAPTAPVIAITATPRTPVSPSAPPMTLPQKPAAQPQPPVRPSVPPPSPQKSPPPTPKPAPFFAAAAAVSKSPPTIMEKKTAPVLSGAVEPKRSWWRRFLLWAAGTQRGIPQALPAPVPPPPSMPLIVPPQPFASPPPKPASSPTPAPVPPRPSVPPATLPVVQPLEILAAAVPPPIPPVQKPQPAPQPPVADVKSFVKDVIDHVLVPALRIMPKTPEDIAKQNRPPVVKLSDE